MAEFWAVVGKNGFAIVALVLVAYGGWNFFINHLWPLLTEQLKGSEKRAAETTKAFLDELKAQREVTEKGFDGLAKLIAARLDRTDDRIDKIDRPHK